MALVPLLHRVIVRPEKAEDVDDVIRRAKAAGIEVKLDKREQAAVEIGIVISKGSTAFRDFDASVTPEIGDKIYYAKYAGKSVKDGEESFLVLNDEDCICIITKGNLL